MAGTVTADNSFYPTPGVVPSWAQPVPNMDATTVAIPSYADPATYSVGRKGFWIMHHPTGSLDTIGSPPIVPNSGLEEMQSLLTQVAQQGWVGVYPICCTDRSTAGGIGLNEDGMAKITANDPAHGTVLVNAERARDNKLWVYLCRKYNLSLQSTVPVIYGGYSLGAWLAAVLALSQKRASGLMMHCLPTIWANALLGNPPGANTNALASTTNTGIDLNAASFGSLSVPAILGWSTADGNVGWNGSSTPVSNVASILSAHPSITSYESSVDEAIGYPKGHLLLAGDVTEYVTNWLEPTFSSVKASF